MKFYFGIKFRKDFRKLSPTMQGTCKNCFEYETDEDIQQMFRSIETA